jgi:hypothetical protein
MVEITDVREWNWGSFKNPYRVVFLGRAGLEPTTRHCLFRDRSKFLSTWLFNRFPVFALSLNRRIKARLLGQMLRIAPVPPNRNVAVLCRGSNNQVQCGSEARYSLLSAAEVRRW